MTSRRREIAKSLGLRGLFLVGVVFWVAAIVLGWESPDPTAGRPSDVEAYFNVILSGN
jgi:hypothetical protein